MRHTSIIVVLLAACGGAPSRFPLRAPMAVDTDLQPVSIPCRPDPTPKEPNRQNCAPEEYVSPFVWDQIDKFLFEPMGRVFSVEDWGEASNVNSLDEVPDSAWFTNRVGPKKVTQEELALGVCKPEDMLPASADVKDGEWIIDHGKDNGATLGFRVNVPGKGLYMLKADDKDQPQRASAASAIGAALYNALGFNTTCEQVVVLRKSQLKLTAGLKVVENTGGIYDFDEAALDKVLASTAQMPNHQVRMQASKWLTALPIGPFTYVGRREDDPNDVIDHEQRRELRGGKIIAAWINHWDAREQNSMDVWYAQDSKDKRSSPGIVKHFIIDTSETLGGDSGGDGLTIRLGDSYALDLRDIFVDLFTFGAIERPWDRHAVVKGRERFHYFTAEDFEPEKWKTLYPNPAYRRATERDEAWAARLIAHLSPADVRTMVGAGHFTDPSDTDYITQLLVRRQRTILQRYLTRLSPLGDIHRTDTDEICATDFARLRELQPAASYRYAIVEHRDHVHTPIPARVGPDGEVCFQPTHVAHPGLADDDKHRYVRYYVTNGTSAGHLVIDTYDLEARGTRLVGATRSEP